MSKADFYISEKTLQSLKQYDTIIISTDVSKQATPQKSVGVFLQSYEDEFKKLKEDYKLLSELYKETEWRLQQLEK